MSKEIQKKEKQEVQETAQGHADIGKFIEMAINKDVGVETLERLFSLHQQAKKEHAKEEFVKDMAKFQSLIPVIKKNKKVMNRDGKTVRYRYATMDSVIEQIKKPLAECGLSYSWEVAREDNHMKVTCTVRHRQGHSEQSSFEIPIVKSEYMSSPQTYATAQTYAKRYTLLNVLGIGTADEDTDAIDADDNADVKSQKARIIFLLKRLGVNTRDKDEIVKAISKKTKIELKEENFKEIINRLEIIVNEKEIC